MKDERLGSTADSAVRVRTTTSVPDGCGRASLRISPWPGAVVQNACASRVIVWAFSIPWAADDGGHRPHRCRRGGPRDHALGCRGHGGRGASRVSCWPPSWAAPCTLGPWFTAKAVAVFGLMMAVALSAIGAHHPHHGSARPTWSRPEGRLSSACWPRASASHAGRAWPPPRPRSGWWRRCATGSTDTWRGAAVSTARSARASTWKRMRC